MKIFKELKKLGYIHYSPTTIEELDDLPLNSAERISEQALVLRWFREKYGISVSITINWEEGIGKDSSYGKYACSLQHKSYDESIREFIGVFEKYEKAELKCLKQLIEMVKSK